MKTLRIALLAFSVLLCSICLAQKIVNVKHGSADFKAVIQSVTPYANAHSAHPVRVKGDTMRRSGDWIFVFSSMQFVDPKNQGDGSLIALMKKGRRWTIREITIGSGELDEIAGQWEKKYKLPSGLFKK